MGLREKISAIEGRRRFGMRPGLERVDSLLERLGRPERGLACVHVAGTNGKGSVAAMTAAVLQNAGLGDVGLYTSPHLVFFNERIRVGGAPIDDDALERALDAVLAADAALDGQATFFELATAAAFTAFRDAGLRLAVIETGLGGRLDATNVIVPVLSVITNIGLEHREWLGNTIAEIAAEKAGIVKPGRPVVLGAMDDEAAAVVRGRAAEVGAAVSDIPVSISCRPARDGSRRVSFEDEVRSVSGIRFSLDGAYQLENLSTAVAALETFSRATGIPLEDAAFKAGLEDVRWPCRFQRIGDDPPVIVDGAHNPPAARALAASLSKLKMPLALVAGLCDDKDAARFLRILHPEFRAAFATETPSPRTLPAAAVADLMRQAGWREPCAEPDWRRAVGRATAWASENAGGVVVCGSLFLAGAAAFDAKALPWRSGAMSANEALAKKAEG